MLEVRNVSKHLGGRLVLDDVSLTIGDREFVSLLGPTGCGKTTLLRIIAGHEKPDSGCIYLDGQDITGLEPHKRNLNTVFQRYALFPHLNVFDNVAFGLRCRRVPEAEVKKRVLEMLELVKMTERKDRTIEFLSGGEQQRVALVRALVNMPKVLLLDEPLSALDAKMKTSLQAELVSIQKQIGISFVFVTHDQHEALMLSHRIALLNQGKIEQLGTGPELYETPQTPFVARFIGQMNFIPFSAVWDVQKNCWKAEDGTPLIGPAPSSPGTEKKDGVIAVRPEKILLRPPKPAQIPLAGLIEDISYLGTHVEVVVQTNAGQKLKIFQQNGFLDGQDGLQVGKTISIGIPSEKSLFFHETNFA